MADAFESTDDARAASQPMRHQYRVLSDGEKSRVADLKDRGEDLLASIGDAGSEGADPRALAVARTKVEEAVMWAVKAVTA